MLKVDSLIAWNIGCAELQMFLCWADRMIYCLILCTGEIHHNFTCSSVPPLLSDIVRNRTMNYFYKRDILFPAPPFISSFTPSLVGKNPPNYGFKGDKNFMIDGAC